jgi:hypothetical protein
MTHTCRYKWMHTRAGTQASICILSGIHARTHPESVPLPCCFHNLLIRHCHRPCAASCRELRLHWTQLTLGLSTIQNVSKFWIWRGFCAFMGKLLCLCYGQSVILRTSLRVHAMLTVWAFNEASVVNQFSDNQSLVESHLPLNTFLVRKDTRRWWLKLVDTGKLCFSVPDEVNFCYLPCPSLAHTSWWARTSRALWASKTGHTFQGWGSPMWPATE